MDLALLFMSAFAASTILPMSSEVVLGALATSGSSPPALLLVVATAGNTLGAVVNWGIGRYAETWRNRLVSLDEAKFQRTSRWFNRWGVWCLLVSWLPVVGDPLTLVAGLLRTPFVPFVLLVLLGKAARYLFVLLIVALRFAELGSRARIRAQAGRFRGLGFIGLRPPGHPSGSPSRDRVGGDVAQPHRSQ